MDPPAGRRLRERGVAVSTIPGGAAGSRWGRVRLQDRRRLARSPGGADKPIVQLAQKADVDLLVIGNRGHGPLAGMFLGSVALRLIQNAPFPVLMVPSRGRMARMKADLEQERAAPALAPSASHD